MTLDRSQWLKDTHLPGWEAMSDLDRGAALLHMWQRFRSPASAVAEFPARYLDDEQLAGLHPTIASYHALAVTNSWATMLGRLGKAEVQRLYDLAEAREIRAERELCG